MAWPTFGTLLSDNSTYLGRQARPDVGGDKRQEDDQKRGVFELAWNFRILEGASAH